VLIPIQTRVVSARNGSREGRGLGAALLDCLICMELGCNSLA
jgi:hypothetical protein